MGNIVPIRGRNGTHDGLIPIHPRIHYTATSGHEGDGSNYAPLTAKAIAAQMAGKTVEIPGVDPAALLPGRLGL